ncbi:phosphatase [Emticicia aquatilis]|uniref:Phosphatase n=1 Tax=Emticicia aquatilis TaxID=1537369 RepID=A0A916YNC2_9BACT|nr:pyridoxamine 5'-phosphate oxidase family protein [Emticicia aquatilis]GGD52893.1 phosphatase [Emticicia aquatilis]
MAKNFAEIGFSSAAKKLQEKMGSRATYARMESQTTLDGLTKYEQNFIAQRDSFYMATSGENGFPYIQHRGGPKGFLKVLDTNRLGFIDFKGNMQYITVGNLETNNKVSLFLVDYPNKKRLKIYATAEVVELKDNPELHHLLDLEGYTFRPERMMVLNIEAYDWNCPQHITPRFTVEEIEEALKPQYEHIKNLKAEIADLKAKLTLA